MTPTIQFYFDFLSPYSFVAYTVLRRLLNGPWRGKVNLTLHPISLPKVMKATGNSPPSAVPARKPFVFKDFFRSCTFYGIPVNPPKNFLNSKTDMANMVVIAAMDVADSAEQVLHIVNVIWNAHMCHSNQDLLTGTWDPISLLLMGHLSPQTMSKLESRLHGNAEALQTRYKDNTQEAIEQGAFGVPTMLVTNAQGSRELFFGSDRFHHIAAFLDLDPTIPYSQAITSHL